MIHYPRELDQRLVALRSALASTDPHELGRSCSGRRVALERAEVELLRVHRIEQARLLSAAAAIVAARSPILRRLGASRFGREDCAGWRAAARAEIEAADASAFGSNAARASGGPSAAFASLAAGRSSGVRVPCLLRRAVARATPRWPSAVRLARSALALDPCDAHRRALAQALVSEGRLAQSSALCARWGWIGSSSLAGDAP